MNWYNILYLFPVKTYLVNISNLYLLRRETTEDVNNLSKAAGDPACLCFPLAFASLDLV